MAYLTGNEGYGKEWVAVCDKCGSLLKYPVQIKGETFGMDCAETILDLKSVNRYRTLVKHNSDIINIAKDDIEKALQMDNETQESKRIEIEKSNMEAEQKEQYFMKVVNKEVFEFIGSILKTYQVKPKVGYELDMIRSIKELIRYKDLTTVSASDKERYADLIAKWTGNRNTKAYKETYAKMVDLLELV